MKVTAIKRLGLIVPAALVVMAFAGTSPATAEWTSLCEEDKAVFSGETYVTTEECPLEKRIGHVHEATLAGAKAKLLTSLINVECNVLYLGDNNVSASLLGVTILTEGHFTYSACNNSCVVKEPANKIAEVVILREGHETARTVIRERMEVKCNGLLNCEFSWAEGEEGEAKGPLLSTETNGDVSFNEILPIGVEGALCPSGKSKLDIKMTPLIQTFIAS